MARLQNTLRAEPAGDTLTLAVGNCNLMWKPIAEENHQLSIFRRNSLQQAGTAFIVKQQFTSIAVLPMGIEVKHGRKYAVGLSGVKRIPESIEMFFIKSAGGVTGVVTLIIK